jgi:transcriptional regulator with XRE-family HTH domain
MSREKRGAPFPPALPAFAEAIVALREARKWGRAQLARELGVTEMTVSNWESGKSEPKPDKYARMARLAPTDDLEIFFRDRIVALDPQVASLISAYAQKHDIIPKVSQPVGDLPEMSAVPLLRDAAAAGAPRMIEEKDVEEWLMISKRFAPNPESVRCVRIKGDSMSPILEEGYIVAIDTADREPKRLVKHMVAASDPDGGVTIKWLRKSAGELLLVPQHVSVRYYPVILTKEAGWRIVGRVMWWIGQPPPPK